MIRPFTLRDLALVHRLSEHAVSLHTESALTHNPHPVRDALFSMIGGDYPTFVWKSDDRDAAGFIQLHVPEESARAHIFFLGTTLGALSEGTIASNGNQSVIGANANAWLGLLDQAVVEIGLRGIHSLVAEVSETGHELPILRRAGFAVYTRQDIWVLEHVNADSRRLQALNLRQPADDWDIQILYANTVPRLVQLVEPLPPLHSGEGWVLREDGELMAFIHLYRGGLGSWLRLFIHPHAELRVDEIVMEALHRVKPVVAQPVFCCVRRYQSWLQGSLNRVGFSLWGSQAVMVKHTVKHQQRPLTDVTAVIEAPGIPASAPLVRQYRRMNNNGKTIVHDRTTNKTDSR
jgi:hypothetical protein